MPKRMFGQKRHFFRWAVAWSPWEHRVQGQRASLAEAAHDRVLRGDPLRLARHRLMGERSASDRAASQGVGPQTKIATVSAGVAKLHIERAAVRGEPPE